MKIKVMKRVHLVAPDTNEAVQPEDKGKIKVVKNSAFWVQAQSQGFVKILNDKDSKKPQKNVSEDDSGNQSSKD